MIDFIGYNKSYIEEDCSIYEPVVRKPAHHFAYSNSQTPFPKCCPYDKDCALTLS